MARSLSNVDINSDSWEIMILKLNEVLRSHTLEILTANTTYANTGNTTVARTAQLYGTLGSNTIIVGNTLRGGNVTGLHANLAVSSNVNIVNAAASNLNLLVSNSSVFSYMNPIGSYIGNTAANSFMNTTSIVVQSNSTVNSSITSSLIRVVNSTSSANITPISFATGISVVNTSQISVGANVTSNATTIRVAAATFGSQSNSSTFTTGNASSIGELSSTQIYVGNAQSYSTLNNTGLNLNNIFAEMTSANGNVGTNISTPLQIYRFDKSLYSSGKFQVQVKNGVTTQISEMILAHDNTTAVVTVYGTVAAPAGSGGVSPLGTFSATVNGANVELLFSQTTINSAIKLVAQLMTA